MIRKIGILGLFIIFLLATAVQAATPLYQLSFGTYHACALDDGGLNCWGGNQHGQSTPMRAKNIRQIAVGYQHTCVLDEEGVLCWGSNENHQLAVPPLKNPRQLSVHHDAACALDDEGVKCWPGFSDVPKLENPREVVAGTFQACAIHDRGVMCWGDDRFGKYPNGAVNYKIADARKLDIRDGNYCALRDHDVVCWELDGSSIEVPKLRNPKQVAVGERQSCALDDQGVKCWLGRDNHDGIKNSVPPLKNPREVGCGMRQCCALDDDGVKCWLGEKVLPVPSLDNPQHLVAGDWEMCALTATGVICWGDDNLPSNSKVSFVWYQFVPFLKKLSQASAPNREKYFSEMLAYYQQWLRSDEGLPYQALFLSFLAPAIESADSEQFKSSIIPEFKKLNDGLSASLARRKLAIEDHPVNRQTALKSIQASLNVAIEFLNPAERQKLQSLLRVIGTAYASPENMEIKQVLKELESNKSTLEILLQSKKTEYLLSSIRVAAGWLESQAK
jgi:hypothetical protein